MDKYKHRAIELLKFGIDHNRRIASEITFDEYYICDELGGLKSFRDEDCYDIVIFVDVEVNDDEIRALIKQLPEFKKWRWYIEFKIIMDALMNKKQKRGFENGINNLSEMWRSN